MQNGYGMYMREPYPLQQNFEFEKLKFKQSVELSQKVFEMMDGDNKMGYDYYSFYLLLRDMHRLKALTIGRYRLRFGMGLILNNSYGFGKLVSLSNLYASTNYIKGHSSRSESNYLQGIAGTIDLGKGFSLTAFASYRKIDASLGKDSSSVVTILRSGYHRTVSEMQRRRNTCETPSAAYILTCPTICIIMTPIRTWSSTRPRATGC